MAIHVPVRKTSAPQLHQTFLPRTAHHTHVTCHANELSSCGPPLFLCFSGHMLHTPTLIFLMILFFCLAQRIQICVQHCEFRSKVELGFLKLTKPQNSSFHVFLHVYWKNAESIHHIHVDVFQNRLVNHSNKMVILCNRVGHSLQQIGQSLLASLAYTTSCTYLCTSWICNRSLSGWELPDRTLCGKYELQPERILKQNHHFKQHFPWISDHSLQRPSYLIAHCYALASHCIRPGTAITLWIYQTWVKGKKKSRAASSCALSIPQCTLRWVQMTSSLEHTAQANHFVILKQNGRWMTWNNVWHFGIELDRSRCKLAIHQVSYIFTSCSGCIGELSCCTLLKQQASAPQPPAGL